MGFHGLEEMANRASFQHESLRELLMKLTPIWSDNPDQLQAAVDTVQILTICQSMTFKCQMDGEGRVREGAFQLSTWVEGSQVFNVPQPRPRASLRAKLADYTKTDHLFRMLSREVKLARIEANNIITQCDSFQVPELKGRFEHIDVMLDDVQTVLRTLG